MTTKNATATQRPHTAPASAAIRPNVVTVTPDDDRGRPTMKAATWHGKRDVRVDTVADPRIQQSTDAIIRVTSSAICGSDLHLYEILGAIHGHRRHPGSRADGDR